MVNEDLSSKSEPEIKKKPEILEDFIKQGLDLIKKEEFRAAIKHFTNKKMSETVGFLFSEGRTFIFNKTPSDESVESILNWVGMNAHFMHITEHKITISRILGAEFSKSGEVKEIELPVSLWQNVALINAEEWLHGLQYLCGQPIAGYEDPEIDVAFYLRNQGVTLTDNFLRAHAREREHPELRNISSQKEQFFQ